MPVSRKKHWAGICYKDMVQNGIRTKQRDPKTATRITAKTIAITIRAQLLSKQRQKIRETLWYHQANPDQISSSQSL